MLVVSGFTGVSVNFGFERFALSFSLPIGQSARMPNLFFVGTFAFVTGFSISMSMWMCWVGLKSDKEVDLLCTAIFLISAAAALFSRAGHGTMGKMSFLVLSSGPGMLLAPFPRCFFLHDLMLLMYSGVYFTIFRF